MSRRQQSILVSLARLCVIVFALMFTVGCLDLTTVAQRSPSPVVTPATLATPSQISIAASQSTLQPTLTPSLIATASSTSFVDGITYTVQSGDTLAAIADRFGIPLVALIAANPNVTPDSLHPGQVLTIPRAGRLTQIAMAQSTAAPATVSPVAAVQSPNQPTLLTVTPAPTLAVIRYRSISGISEHAHQIFLYGQTLGNRANTFSKVGDSITLGFNYVIKEPAFLYPIGKDNYNLEGYSGLQPVVDFYLPAMAQDGNPFVHTSLAAKGGWSAGSVIDPHVTNPNCNVGEAPLDCEYRVVKPSVALIMLGTNDVRTTPPDAYERYLRKIIETSIGKGIIPVVSTIPALHRDWAAGRVEPLNQVILKLAQEYDVPLWDYAAALRGLPNDGLSLDGVHPSVPPNGRPADFTAENLKYGYTVRNLTALQVLDAIWRSALHP
jgi:LysM repeat protein